MLSPYFFYLKNTIFYGILFLLGGGIMTDKIENVIKNLQKNNINVTYCEKKEEVAKIVEKMLPIGATISAGGSTSLKECGIMDLIAKPCYSFFDRNRQGITPEEQQEVFKKVIGIDYYFCSTNALTEKGELLNVDGLCNRVSAITFGPKKVVMVVGANKIVENLNEAFLRVKKIAAPRNCVRLGLDNPCAKLGHCVSLFNNDNPDFTDGCNKDTRICINYVVSGFQRNKERMNIILCGEDLGY